MKLSQMDDFKEYEDLALSTNIIIYQNIPTRNISLNMYEEP